MNRKARRAGPGNMPPALEAKSRRAIELHQQGKLAEAEAAYRELLVAMPAHFDALHLLGVIKGQQNDYAAAAEYLERALSIKPDSAGALANYANVLQASGRHSQSLTIYDRSLALRPGNAKSLTNRGNVLRKLGRPAEALGSYEQALELDGDYVEARIRKGDALSQLGRREEAVAAYRDALQRGGNEEWIHYSLAVLGVEPAPKSAPPDYVKRLFDQYAGAFDTHLLGTLLYRTPSLLIAAVQPFVSATALDAVDLGCGTGLCGPLLRPLSRKLIGVDLSPNMLDKARERAVYDDLACAEIAAYLEAMPASYDLAIAADVFVYIGDLSDVFKAASSSLRPGGVFGFSVEAAADDTGFVLQPSHRYAHGKDYLRDLAVEHGFVVESFESSVIRKDDERDIAGFLMVMKRPA